jgi:polyisoprenoid-binding protein YceI
MVWSSAARAAGRDRRKNRFQKEKVMNRKLPAFWTPLVAAVVVFAAASIAAADDLKVDPMHSFVVFSVHHFQAGYVFGTFANPSGDVTYDPSDPEKSSFNVEVSIDTLDTRNKNRDKDLKGPDFFNAKQFPTMTFKSSGVKKTGDTTMDVTGDLTLKGVTKSITVPMEMTGTGQAMGKTHTGFETNFTIKRSDFGMLADPAPMIGDEVRVIVALEALK